MSGGAFEDRLAACAIELPRVPVPIARFKPWRKAGDLVYLAGQICEWNGEVRFVGKVGVEHDLEGGQSAARICALNLLAALRQACDDDLDRVDHCVRLGGFVNCSPDFDAVPFVVNGASDLMIEVFGDHGEHCRTAIGVASLPRCAAVEVDAVFRLKS
jgi:enamine deaminase RidA (YjgF/YER057c/UK114 family)